MLLRFMTAIANITDALAFIGGLVAVWLTLTVMDDASNGGVPQVGSMVFAIAFAVIPYCISGTVHRLISLQRHFPD